MKQQENNLLNVRYSQTLMKHACMEQETFLKHKGSETKPKPNG